MRLGILRIPPAATLLLATATTKASTSVDALSFWNEAATKKTDATTSTEKEEVNFIVIHMIDDG